MTGNPKEHVPPHGAPPPGAPLPSPLAPEAAAQELAGLPDCGDFSLRIAADGTWFHEGSPIGRKPLVRLFARVLRADKSGGHWLITPAERGRVEVEDSAFIAVEAERNGEAWCLRTNLDQWVRLGPEHPLRLALSETGEPRPYAALWRGLEARLLRPVFYHLIAEAEEISGENALQKGEARRGIHSQGLFFPLDTPHGHPAHTSQPEDPRWGDGY